MLKCTGRCAQCGRCMAAADEGRVGAEKANLMNFPENFTADKGGEGLAAAFDLGTTTVVGMLWDLESGELLTASAAANPQGSFGGDVISRISHACRSDENLADLQKLMAGSVMELCLEMCGQAGRLAKDIRRITVCGNTAMSHLFAGRCVKGLAMAPFEPDYVGTLKMEPSNVGIELPGCSEVTVIPNIAGHVGGDITAGLAASGVLDLPGLTVFVDIGTNGEIVLLDGDSNRMYACSTAAGPAFEGASIEQGMRAADGAIESVSIEKVSIERAAASGPEGCRVSVKTIGNKPAVGICGSGLIEAVAQMLDGGIIDYSGRLLTEDDADGQRRFLLAEAGAANGASARKTVAITQKDIREVQLAKAAILAGIEIMLQRAGKTIDDIDYLVIAGAFGSHIDIGSAMRIGLLPSVDADKVICVGNAAGTGVSMALVNADVMKLIEEIPDRVEHVELANEADFQTAYINAMNFRVGKGR